MAMRAEVVMWIEITIMICLAVIRLVTGSISIYFGELSVEQPEWVFDVMGQYPVPKNFGWDWVTPALVPDPAGDEYDFATNAWMLQHVDSGQAQTPNECCY